MRKENLYEPDCIRTFTGKYVNIFQPKPEMFCIEDIAHALAFQCRFGGHLPKFYSVAQHSLDVSNLVPPELALTGLLHDATEAYLIDIPRPIKLRMPQYLEIEENLNRLLSEIFGFKYPFPEKVKEADNFALEAEWNAIMLQKQSWCLSPPAIAESKFISEYERLRSRCERFNQA